MAPLSFEERECERFLRIYQNSVDPTWGFYVYGTYTRPQRQKEADEDSDRHSTQEAADQAHFQTILNKMHAHAANMLRYAWPAPYNQRFIDDLRLQPAAYLPGASLTDVCTHFREHYADIRGADSDHDGPNDKETDDDLKHGPKHSWCLVVDDESLQSIENGPEPIDPTPPIERTPWELAYNASELFIILLTKDFTTMEKPVVLSAQTRTGGGRRREWNGWMKFSLDRLKQAFEETHAGDPETYFESPDKLVDF